MVVHNKIYAAEILEKSKLGNIATGKDLQITV
jgi:hypothetical protein